MGVDEKVIKERLKHEGEFRKSHSISDAEWQLAEDMTDDILRKLQMEVWALWKKDPDAWKEEQDKYKEDKSA